MSTLDRFLAAGVRLVASAIVAGVAFVILAGIYSLWMRFHP